ncbi:MAG: DNA gyrase C-terminal beta-propeller domain-containing protein [Armatimonadota bacterium]
MADAALIVTTNGRAKIVTADQYPTRGRGGKGVKSWGELAPGEQIAAVEHVCTESTEDVIVLTARGMALRVKIAAIPTRSRTAGGVKLIDVAPGDRVVAVKV